MNRTIKQIAAELSVSKTTIANEIKKLNIEPEKIGNKFLISDVDVERIKLNLNSEKSQNENAKNAKNVNFANNAKNANQTAKNANENANQQLIDMLQKALEDKENTIRKQLETIDTLTKTNAVLTTKIAFLEDKSKPEPEVITPDEGTTKIRWWQKLFNT